MEEDIKVIENIIYNVQGKKMSYVDVDYAEGEKFINAIENLIKGYKELEEKADRLGKLYYEANENCIKYEKDYIPKSKVREKIDEKIEYYNSYKGLEIYKKDNFKEIVITLEQLKQQLLQEGDK